MSAIPPIEIVWGGGNDWTDGLIESASPTIVTALKLADEGLLELDIDYEDPKTATIILTDRRSTVFGEAYDSFDFNIYINKSNIFHQSIAAQLPQLFITSAHEMLHCVRFEDEDCGTASILDSAAHEGLSYVGEYLAGEVVFGRRIDSLGSFLVNPLKIYEKYQKKEKDLLELALSECDRVVADEVHRKWFDVAGGENLPLGAVLGILAVSRLLDSRGTLSAIIKMPSKKIFGLE